MLDLIPMLETDDIQKTIDFYTKVLNFELKSTYESKGETTWIMLQCGKAAVMFSTRFCTSSMV